MTRPGLAGAIASRLQHDQAAARTATARNAAAVFPEGIALARRVEAAVALSTNNPAAFAEIHPEVRRLAVARIEQRATGSQA